MKKRMRRTKADVNSERKAVYWRVIDAMDMKKSMVFTTKAVNIATEIWKLAAKKCGLYFRKGWLYAGNNRYKFPFIYMPDHVESFPNDIGKTTYLAKGGYWIRMWQMSEKEIEKFFEENEDTEEFEGKRLFKATKVCSQEGESGSVIVYENLKLKMQHLGILDEEKDRCIPINKFRLLLDNYTQLLAKNILKPDEPTSYSGWRNNWGKVNRMYYVINDDTILDDLPENPLDILKANRIRNPINSVLFGATLFSIMKSIFRRAKLPTDFTLYLTTSKIDKNYYLLRDCIYFYSNPQVYDDFEKFIDCEEISHYSFEHRQIDVLSTLYHKNFPILYSLIDYNYPEDDEYNGIHTYETHMFTLHYGQRDAEIMKNATALPILLSPVMSTKQKPYDSCLSLFIPVGKSDRDNMWRKYNHEQLFLFYSGFICFLNKNWEQHISRTKRLYAKSLKELNSDPKTATARQKQIACMLTAVYWAEEYVISEQRESLLLFSYTRNVLKSLAKGEKPARQRVASVTAFADFLNDLMNRQENQFPLLLQDEHYLYLDFKEYWSAFEDYCHANDILITESHKGFRREHLAKEFLKPQYEPKPGEYPRYDYRKLIGTKKETVLVVKKTILEYALVRKDPKLN